MNHVTVMFKKSSVLKAGNYQSCFLMEDTLLWVNMFNSGCKAKNIDDFWYMLGLEKICMNVEADGLIIKNIKLGEKKCMKPAILVGGIINIH